MLAGATWIAPVTKTRVCPDHAMMMASRGGVVRPMTEREWRRSAEQSSTTTSRGPRHDPKHLEALALLLEECSEVIQVAGKIIRHGIGSWDNAEDLAREVGNVLAAIDIALHVGILDRQAIEDSKMTKLRDVRQWLHHVELRGGE